MTTRNYEAMFILDNNAATADFDATSGKVDEILLKHGAKLVQKEKWDERKLAYEIKGRRRGTYYLTYFEAEPTAITKIHEDVHLSEEILRHMVIVLDQPIADYIETYEKECELLAEDSRKNSLGGWGDRRRTRGAPPPRSKSDGDGDGDRPAAPARTPETTPEKPKTTEEPAAEAVAAVTNSNESTAPEPSSDAGDA